jgi:ribosomal protein L14E/L6E/L27E
MSDIMALVEVGRVCIKKFGRDAGDKAVVTRVIDKNFVEIMTHTRPKARKSNIKHLEFLSEKVDPKNTAELNLTLEIEAEKEHRQPARATPKK